MKSKALYTQDQLWDYSSLFSRSEALSWLNKDFNSIKYKINRYDVNWKMLDNVTYVDYLQHIYKILENNYPNEYILKNSFITEWIIKEICNIKSKVFNEFRLGNSIADLVIFNGNSKVFEIKTEFDSDKRLDSQIKNYQKIFNQIFVIIPIEKLHIYEKYNSDIGIITYENSTKYFNIYREAPSRININPSAIMQILHTREYKEIVKCYFGELPKMTSFNQFEICKKFISEIPQIELNIIFINQMKKRDINNIFSSRYYKEFNQLSLALNLNKHKKKELIHNLKISLKE